MLSFRHLFDYCRSQYHIERHDILERNITGLVTIHEVLIYDLRTTARRKTEHVGLFRGGLECLDPRWRPLGLAKRSLNGGLLGNRKEYR